MTTEISGVVGEASYIEPSYHPCRAWGNPRCATVAAFRIPSSWASELYAEEKKHNGTVTFQKLAIEAADETETFVAHTTTRFFGEAEGTAETGIASSNVTRRARCNAASPNR